MTDKRSPNELNNNINNIEGIEDIGNENQTFLSTTSSSNKNSSLLNNNDDIVSKFQNVYSNRSSKEELVLQIEESESENHPKLLKTKVNSKISNHPLEEINSEHSSLEQQNRIISNEHRTKNINHDVEEEQEEEQISQPSRQNDINNIIVASNSRNNETTRPRIMLDDDYSQANTEQQNNDEEREENPMNGISEVNNSGVREMRRSESGLSRESEEIEELPERISLASRIASQFSRLFNFRRFFFPFDVDDPSKINLRWRYFIYSNKPFIFLFTYN
jgi:hypothetical protein